MVFQGTVLGPSLWNGFFGSIATYVPNGSQRAQVFADDLNVLTQCPMHVSNDLVKAELEEAQGRAHAWGRRHRVTFDPSKESIHIVHPLYNEGSEFKELGTLLDSALTMRPLIDHLLSKLRPKIRALARLKYVYNRETLMSQFKTHIWGAS